jgi:hypothetical protein
MDAAVFANAAAALTTTKLGAQPALPKRKAVLALLRRAGWKYAAQRIATRRQPLSVIERM